MDNVVFLDPNAQKTPSTNYAQLKNIDIESNLLRNKSNQNSDVRGKQIDSWIRGGMNTSRPIYMYGKHQSTQTITYK
jgi:predicted methyltransferase MtxX (methanogen marker protein 4)